ncbi:MAG TPA: hypothetical protein VNZ64_06625 [Candidatus Acidoferrum sp.]|jgi:hypothetical protein|nr:hypothetical protein [Candidatus Acidoferrum sp.]
MEHTQIVTVAELENYANTKESEAVVPELIWTLVKESVSDLTTCRVPYGDAINQPGWDGQVETQGGFRQFVPQGRSFWEIGTGGDPQGKATSDFKKRTEGTTPETRRDATYVFVTPRSAGAGGWNEPAQAKWTADRKDSGWARIKILDGVQVGDWLREYPAIGKWLLKRMGLVKTTSGFSIPTEHWENLQQLSQANNDPPIPPKLFLVGRDQARAELLRLFGGETKQLAVVTESENDAEDFVAACLAELDADTRRSFSNKCLFVKEAETWHAMAGLRNAHIFVAHPKLDLEDTGEQLHMTASKKGHGIVIPVSGSWARGNDKLIILRSPSASMIETTLAECGYPHDRARELAGAGALNLGALKRYLRGLGELPPYASWDSARLLAQAGMAGRWFGENAADKSAMETLLGKSYGEWIELVRPETLRSDTPLIQRNESWKLLSRGEAWSAVGPRISNDDLDRFQKAAIVVLGERDPKFELPPDNRFAASPHGKVLKHSGAIRKGIAETLALLGSRPQALTSCSQGKPEFIAALIVRTLLRNADWMMWASLDYHLPLIAEAAPDEFLNAVEAALLNPADSPFNAVFGQERPGVMGCNYTSGLLWALETLAWHSDYVQRVTILLGELAAIDPGGNWSNRPANSLTDIFLPWHPQTCAAIPKRKSAVESLLKEQPTVGWKLLLSLLPHMHGFTSGCRKPAWRQFIPAGWSDKVTNREYWEQVMVYADLAIGVAKVDLAKLAELIDRLPNLPNPAHSRVLDHFSSEAILDLPESSRLPIWEALVDLAGKHRKFPDAQWVMPPEVIARIEEVASKLAPKSPMLVHRRVFSDRDFELFDVAGDYEEQEKKLAIRRQEAIREILNTKQLKGLLEFARQVTNPGKVGLAFGQIDWESADAALLPDFLNNEDKVLRAFVANFVWGRFWTKSWQWVDGAFTQKWTTDQKATFFTFLPFGHETWRRAEAVLGQDAGGYWKKANVQPYGPQPHLLEAVEKLLQHERPRSALACLSRLVHEKAEFAPPLAVQGLMDSLKTPEPMGGLDQHNLSEIIKWLQANPATNREALFKIEWTYLPLLDDHYGGSPKTLETRLATDPSFFCEVISIVFRPDKDPTKKREPSETEQAVAQNAYRLLRAWQTVPGANPDAGFDDEAFGKWLEEVTRRTKESGHYRIALDQIGQVLPHSPPDPDGLWIHRSVAAALNGKDAEEMRSGFTCQLINMRGVYGFSAGKEELKIAAGYHKQADALEASGFHRLATAMRELAKHYERDAERDSKRDPFED